MCGSLLSKFRKKKNMIYRGITIFPSQEKAKAQGSLLMKTQHVMKTEDFGTKEISQSIGNSFIGICIGITSSGQELVKRCGAKLVRG